MASPSADCAATAGSESENEEEKMDFEDWGEDEPAPTKCLFTDRVFDSVHECLAHSAESFGLDLMQACCRRMLSRRAARRDPMRSRQLLTLGDVPRPQSLSAAHRSSASLLWTRMAALRW